MAAHELTHGLGFASNLVEYKAVFGANVKSGYVAPQPLNPNNAPIYFSTILSGLEPIGIYDTFITGRNYNFKALGKKIEQFGNQNIAAITFLKKFEASGAPFEAAQQIYQDSTRGDGNLFFNALDGSKIPLFSPITFLQGSSISHVAESAERTENFLMIPRLRGGVTIKSVMDGAGSKSIYGKDIIKIFQAIGWPTPGYPILKYLELNLGFDGTVAPTSSDGQLRPFDTIWLLLILFLIY